VKIRVTGDSKINCFPKSQNAKKVTWIQGWEGLGTVLVVETL